jgi:hypothetical protein
LLVIIIFKQATGHSFAAPYFSSLEVPGLHLPPGWPYAIASVWRGAPSAPSRTRGLGAHAFNSVLGAALGGKATRGPPCVASGALPMPSAASELRPGPRALALAFAGCARLARAGWACMPQTLGFMAWADDSRGRELSYHDFLALRAAAGEMS